MKESRVWKRDRFWTWNKPQPGEGLDSLGGLNSEMMLGSPQPGVCSLQKKVADISLT